MSAPIFPRRTDSTVALKDISWSVTTVRATSHRGTKHSVSRHAQPASAAWPASRASDYPEPRPAVAGPCDRVRRVAVVGSSYAGRSALVGLLEAHSPRDRSPPDPSWDPMPGRGLDGRRPPRPGHVRHSKAGRRDRSVAIAAHDASFGRDLTQGPLVVGFAGTGDRRNALRHVRPGETAPRGTRRSSSRAHCPQAVSRVFVALLPAHIVVVT
jgi:hypothetical protein